MSDAREQPGIARARMLCALAYAAALVAGALVVRFAPIASSWWRVAAADGVATLVVFAFSLRFDNSSFYDPYWSVAPIAMGGFWALSGEGQAPALRQIACFGLVALWGVRLTYNWLRQWRGLKHEDWRYVELRGKTGRGYWVVSLLGLHAFPTVQVLMGSYALYVALVVGARPLGWLDALAALVMLASLWIEALADRQLHDFVTDNRDPERILDTGLWKYSRHPNYFGEVLFWWGLYLFALAAQPSAWQALIGPLAITAMFFFVSIPLLDTRMVAKRPHYAEHMKRVSRLVPWFVSDGE
jgi:steroid 5-alpha reductase family enzyme